MPQPRRFYADTYGILIQVVGTMLIGLVLAFTICPKMAGVMLGIMPVMAIGSIIQGKIAYSSGESGNAQTARPAIDHAATTISHVKTVVSTGQAKFNIDMYLKHLDAATSTFVAGARKLGFVVFWSELSKFCCFALAFWYAGQLFHSGDCGFDGVFAAMWAVLLCAIIAGYKSSEFPDTTNSTSEILEILRLKDSMPAPEPSKPAAPKLTGRIEFRDVTFAYPSRPDAAILDKFNLTIEPYETVAIVGSSGSGKTTIMSLIQVGGTLNCPHLSHWMAASCGVRLG